MKVVHIETGRHLYGGALQVCYLMEGLAGHGVANLLVCSRGSAIAKTASGYATVIELPIAGDLDLMFPFRLAMVLRRYHPDIVHVHSRRGADLWSGISASLCRIPSVLTRRVDNQEWPPFARLKYESYDRVVTISEGIRRVLLNEGVNPEKVSCIHSVVRTEDYQLQSDRAWFADQFGVQADAPLVGVIAQLIARKGHRYLLDITRQLVAHFPKLQIVFFGQGPLRADLEKQVNELGLAAVVHFAGFRKDMPQILPCLDLVVHPALMEGLGVSLLQAAAAGVPIVGTRSGGIPEIVHHQENGLVVEPGNTEQLFEAVHTLLANPGLARRCGAAGRNLVQRSFSLDTMIKQYIGLYNKLIDA